MACLSEVDPLLEKALLQGAVGGVVCDGLEVELHLGLHDGVAVRAPLPGQPDSI